MSRPSARVLVGERASMAAAIEASMSAGVPAVLTFRGYLHLKHELGSEDAAFTLLVDLATKYGKPILLNLPRSNGESTTVSIAPRGWSDERLQGFTDGMADELAEEFGPVARIGSPL